MQPRRHALPVPNLASPGTHELVFYDWGDVNAQRVVICVHGLTRNAHDFVPLAEALAATGRRVFSLNMAGRGESAWLADPMGYNYATYVADCLAVMDNFHLRSVEWIGTSMGGLIGMMLAASNPARIRKLVINDIGIHLNREALERIFGYVNAMPPRFETRAAAEEYLATSFAPFKLNGTEFWPRFFSTSFFPNADGSLRYACDPAIAVPIRESTKNFTDIQSVNLSDVWEKVTIPTLILRGEESDILSLDTVRAMRSVNSRTDVMTVPGVGHAPPLMSDDQIRPLMHWLAASSTGLLAAGF